MESTISAVARIDTDRSTAAGENSKSESDDAQMLSRSLPSYSPTIPDHNSPPDTIVRFETEDDDAVLQHEPDEMTASKETNKDPLHPKSRPGKLSKQEMKVMRAYEKLKGPPWKPGDTIRLLAEWVHIRTDPEERLNIDPHLPFPPAIPKRPAFPLKYQMMFAGIEPTGKSQRGFYEDAISSGWVDGFPIFIRVFPIGPQKVVAHLVDASGRKLECVAAAIQWRPGLESLEKRREAAIRLLLKIKSEYTAMDDWFQKEAKRYRIGRRLWEIEVVKHEYRHRQNYDLFHPATTREAVQRAIRMGKNDIEAEDEDDRTFKYSGWVLIQGKDRQSYAQRVERY